MKEFLEGSQAIAEAVRLCKPGVISAYPITPQTHIVEELAALVADGKLKSQFVNVESEHSAASVVLGGSAAGVRSYTATSSQGLLLMGEVVFNIAGLRLPVVMTCANRAISAPINIWNDQQDSISLRDSGWVQLYAENLQEAVDQHFLAYRLGEDASVMLPVMVCMDGFILTHGIETVELPDQQQVERFLPAYKPLYKLDPADPMTIGPLVDPDAYMETRYAVEQTLARVLELYPKVTADFSKVFGRTYPGLIEGYRLDDAERAIVAMGSVCGTIKEVIDEQRKKGKKIGLLKIVAYRPFPAQEVYEALKDVKCVGVVDRALSLGAVAPLSCDVRALFCNKKKRPSAVNSFVVGLGGRDVTLDSIRDICKLLCAKERPAEFIDLKPELLKEKYE